MFISPSRSPFCSQTLPKCPQTESSSVLKRPSDSNSALFSVTPRDRLVYASGTVRSTASNNAPYIDRVRQRELHSRTHNIYRHTYTTAQTQITNTHTHTSRQLYKCTFIHTNNKVHKSLVWVLRWAVDYGVIWYRYFQIHIDLSVHCRQKKTHNPVCELRRLMKRVYLLDSSTMCQTNQTANAGLRIQGKTHFFKWKQVQRYICREDGEAAVR